MASARLRTLTLTQPFTLNLTLIQSLTLTLTQTRTLTLTPTRRARGSPTKPAVAKLEVAVEKDAALKSAATAEQVI